MKFYDLTANAPDGTPIDMKGFRGKTILIINTATKCGLTPQFEGLENLHQKYKDKGLVVIGFPCNQFASQEPETNDTLVQVCKINHGVTFLLTEKVEVNGKNTHPIFHFLKNELGGILGKKIKWNFTKFLIDSTGIPFKRYSPTTQPQSIEKDVLKLISN